MRERTQPINLQGGAAARALLLRLADLGPIVARAARGIDLSHDEAQQLLQLGDDVHRLARLALPAPLPPWRGA